MSPRSKRRPDPSKPVSADLGVLPEWTLPISIPDSIRPNSPPTKRAEGECAPSPTSGAVKSAHRQRLGVGNPPPSAVKGYEALQDLLGRIMAYAGLVYAGNTTDPACAKFYGDAQEKITAYSTDLLFFQLELNRINDALVEGLRLGARSPITGRGWKTYAGQTRTNSTTELDCYFTKSRSPPRRVGIACSTRRSPACASTSTVRNCRSSP